MSAAPRPPARSPLGLYVHVPFCAAICNYCNFSRGLFDSGLKDDYLGALVQEIESAADGSPVDSVYFGGGTPSLLEPHEVGRVLDACRAGFSVADDVEVTLEANPESLSELRAWGYLHAGVNRISIGIQSFDDGELQRLSRLHSAARGADAVAAARAAGICNVSLDLMMWLPEQTIDAWLNSVDRLIELGPEHASLYMLEVYPNAPLREAMARADWSQAPDDDAADMYTAAMERLEGAGYEQYEISNVARPGHRSRHNLKYWTDGEWLGLGPAAHSTRAGARWRNVTDVSEYVRRVQRRELVAVERRDLSPAEVVEEAIFTRLRLAEGIDLAQFDAQYGTSVWGTYGEKLETFLDAGLLIYDGHRMRLTRAGLLLAHEVMAVFVS